MSVTRARIALVHQVASAQAGLVTARQLAEIGIPTSTVSRRTRPGGMWSRVLPGVHLVWGGRPDRTQRELATLLYAGPGAMLTGITALRRHEPRLLVSRWLPDDDYVVEQVHVLVPHSRRRVSVAFVDIERTRHMPTQEEVGRVEGLSIAPVARAVVDAGRRMRTESDVSALVTSVIRLELATAAEMTAELRASAVRGSAFLREALIHASVGVWSPWEARLRDLLPLTGLPEPLWNPRIIGADGSYVAVPDAWFDAVALAIEVDSAEHHGSGEGWKRTLARQARYAAVGVACLPLTPQQIRDQPDQVVALIKSAHRAASERPRPPVRVGLALVRAEGRRSPVSWAG